jgi:GT2 family glycosyltransferase
VLIGSQPTTLPIQLPANVFFLGEKPISDLPAYLKHADFAFLPFLPGKISDSVSPIKIFEYLFMGKAVVATDLPEVRNLPGVSCARDPDEFSDFIFNLKNDRNVSSHQREIDYFIMKNSWGSRLESILGVSNNIGKVLSVIILTHNNADIIERVIDSLLVHGHKFIYEIIVVDNASTDNSVELLEKYPEIVVVKNEKNGCSSGRNLGVAYSKGEFIMFLDSDQFLTSGLGLYEGLEILKANPKIGAVGWAAGWFEGTSHLSGPISEYLPSKGMGHSKTRYGYRTDVGYLGTGGMICRSLEFKSLWSFDEKYDPTCFEDTDLSFQIKNSGYLLSYRRLSGIVHQAHQTTKSDAQKSVYEGYFNRNQTYFRTKWRNFPQFFTKLID